MYATGGEGAASILKVLDERPEGKVKADAVAGNAGAALDYGLR